MRKKNCFAVIALLMTAAMLFLAGCGAAETGKVDADGSTAAASSQEPETTAEQVYDCGGATFTVFTFADDTLSQLWYYGADEQIGEIFNDAIYERNVSISNKYNVDLNYFGFDDTDSVGKNLAQKVSESILSGDNEYDLVVTHMHKGTVQLLNQGYLANWLDVPGLNLDAPWYSTSVNENLTIQGYLPCIVSDFNITSQIFTFALIFNKRMAESYGLTSPYEMVKAGGWTLDYFSDYIKVAAADVDGNGTYDENDSYGYTGNTGISMQAFVYGAGVKFVELENGKPVIQLESEKFATVYEKIKSLYDDDHKTFINQKVDALCPIPFDSDRILFISIRFAVLDSYRNVTDFGIVPYPKYDEKQEDYCSYMDARGALTLLPITNTELEMTGVLVEALSKTSYESVVPVYCDTVLESKYARDEETLEMLDLIFANRVFDFGYVYRTNPLTFAAWNIYNSKKEPASYLAAEIPAAQAHFDAVYESYLSWGKSN